MDMHPSQYQTPMTENSKALPVRPIIPANVMLQPVTYQERSFGQKINQAFYLTVAFLVLTHSHKFLNNIYSVWSNQPHVLMNEVGVPTLKGVIVTAGLFFIVALWFLKR